MLLRALILAVAVLGSPAVAGAVTLADIIQLSKAGLPDAVLTALIDADRTVFTLNAEQILQLRDAGVSEAVMLKLIGTRRWDDAPPGVQPARPPQPGEFSDGSIGPELLIIGDTPPAEPAGQTMTVVVPFGFGSPFFNADLSPRHRHSHRQSGIQSGYAIRNGEFVGVAGSTFNERRARSLRQFESSVAHPDPGRR
jgi:hypothetical protein